ncbi:MAG: NAD(P)/FAD-dependent oxidoreductase [Candidatus Puniceispirillales bacterium]
MAEKPLAVIVVGAGMVGVSTAIWLQRAGHQVTLIDKIGPAGGTSYGNAGILASGSVVPVTTPGLLGKAPGMLFDPHQPLFLKWGYLPKLMPWLFRYLGHANHKDTNRIADALTPVIGESLADHQALAAGTGAEDWITPADYAYIYKSRAAFEKDALTWQIRQRLGFTWDEYEGQAIAGYEPAVAGRAGFIAAMNDHGFIRSPGDYITALVRHFEKQGGRLIIADVEGVSHENGIATGVRAGGEWHQADRVALTTGVWSGQLARQFGIRIPLESERGYHIELWEPSHTPQRPLYIASGKFVITPMDGRIRLAGVVEFGGLEAGPSAAPFALLRHHLAENMPELTWREETEWMGHRPAPVDSIPVISDVPGYEGAFMGFGHHHVGLTGGPKTGRLLASMITGQRPNIDLETYSIKRFMDA